MFTRMAKGILTTLVIVGAIFSLIIGIWIGSLVGGDNNTIGGFGVGFVVTIAGWIVTFLFSCALGMFVELANNVMDCKQLMQQMVDKMGRADLPRAAESSSNGNGNSADPRDLPKKNDEFWKCPDCGTKNENFRYICQRCGRNR